MRVTQEPEGLQVRQVMLGAVVLGGLSVLSVVAAYLVLLPSPGAVDRGSPRPPAMFGEPAHIETSPFISPRGPATRTAARARLRAYGWVDRSAGVVHVPIERAIDLYLSTGGSTQPTTSTGAGKP